MIQKPIPTYSNYTGVTFRTRTEEARAIFDEVRQDIWPAVESRKLQLPIDKGYLFDEIGSAFEPMARACVATDRWAELRAARDRSHVRQGAG